MIKISFNQQVGDETIAGLILSEETKTQQPQCVYIHGGGQTSFKENIYNFADPIIKQNKSILSFDFSGHGESTGTLSSSSLKKRVAQAQAVIENRANPRIILAASMGAYIALKLLNKYPIDTLILLCPALYDAQAYEAPFNQEFSTIIRAHESWRNTDVLQNLKIFFR